MKGFHKWRGAFWEEVGKAGFMTTMRDTVKWWGKRVSYSAGILGTHVCVWLYVWASPPC